jgi:hypothetical protein
VRTQVVRSEVLRLLHQAPFRPFILSLENGQTATIEHPENIAFDPGPEASPDFYVISGPLRMFSTFEAVSSVSLLDIEGRAGRENGSD